MVTWCIKLKGDERQSCIKRQSEKLFEAVYFQEQTYCLLYSSCPFAAATTQKLIQKIKLTMY